ncbi:MAG: C25 family cysteine peptidase, partial [Nannocystaceae bacterium]
GVLGTTEDVGAPELPIVGRYVDVPEGYEASVSATRQHVKTFKRIRVLPSQAHMTDSGEDTPFAYDPKAYARGHDAPPLAQVSEPFLLGDRRVALLTVRPCAYDAGTARLEVAGQVHVELRFRRMTTIRLREGRAIVTVNRPWKAGALEARRSIAVAEAIRPKLTFPFLSDGPEFLIVHTNALAAPAERLARWKNERGLRSETVEFTDIGTDVDDLKLYLRIRMLLTPLRYVLLMGDVDAIPADTTNGYPTDQRYAELIDADTDEPFAPRIAIGRMPVRTEAQGNAAVSKVIAFERDPPASCGYYRHLLFCGYFQDDTGDGQANRAYLLTLEGICDHLVSLGYDVDRVYVSNNATPQRYKDGTNISQEVKDAILDDMGEATDRLVRALNEGRLFFVHRDHGSSDGWIDPPLRRSHLDEVHELVPSNFFSINCSTGQIDLAGANESFAEKLLRLGGGVPSVIAAVRNTNTTRNDRLTEALCDGLWSGVLPAFPGGSSPYEVRARRLGDLLNYAKAYVQEAYSNSTSSNRRHGEYYHVVGDPTLELWIDPPVCAKPTVGYANGRITMRVPYLPLGAVWTLWSGDEQLARIEPNATTTSWTVPLSRRLQGDLQVAVCFHAPAHLFTKTFVNVPGVVLAPIFPKTPVRAFEVLTTPTLATRAPGRRVRGG